MSGLKRMVNRLPHIPKEAGIYMITDNATGKSYVGSSGNMNSRLGNYTTLHMSKSKSKHLAGFNFDDCTMIVLENCKYLSLDQRLQLELEYIISLNTIHPNGFNKRSPVTNLFFNIIAKVSSKPKEYKITTPIIKEPLQKPKYRTKTMINVIKW